MRRRLEGRLAETVEAEGGRDWGRAGGGTVVQKMEVGSEGAEER